jgi:hypothetical protein
MQSSDDLRILIVSTPRTGNTWIKYCLSLIYDLPVVDFPAPEFWRTFDAKPYDQLGNRWIAHQHVPPFEPLVRWASDRGVVLVTTVRHPADSLVSLCHYVQDFGGKVTIDAETVQLLSSNVLTGTAGSIRRWEGLEQYVREKFFKNLHFSIAWLQRNLSYGLRYEDLWRAPTETFKALTDYIAPVPNERLLKGVENSRLEQMRKHAGPDALFFRGGGVESWRRALPSPIVQMLRQLPPYPSQIRWLGYDPDDYAQVLADPAPDLTTRHPPAASTLPFLQLDLVGSDGNMEAYYPWLNAVSDGDPTHGRIAPTITNLGTRLYQKRPDLQTSFPDLYEADRVAFSHWFTEVNFVGSQKLDPFFLVPVYESWLTGPHPSFNPIHRPTRAA